MLRSSGLARGARPASLYLQGCEWLALPTLLGDHETAKDALQVFVLVLPNPQRGLGVA